jgi:hypothetical protein
MVYADVSARHPSSFDVLFDVKARPSMPPLVGG